MQGKNDLTCDNEQNSSLQESGVQNNGVTDRAADSNADSNITQRNESDLKK